jgi:hypothetical protein
MPDRGRFRSRPLMVSDPSLPKQDAFACSMRAACQASLNSDHDRGVPSQNGEYTLASPNNFTTNLLPIEAACRRCGAIDRPRLTVGTSPHAGRENCSHCGAFIRWTPRQRTPEECARKAAQAATYREQYMREQAPTERQIKYLRRLGFSGPPPFNKYQASQAIDRLLKERSAR